MPDAGTSQHHPAGTGSRYGFEFETRPEIQVNEITSDIKVLIFYHPDNLGSLSNSALNTQFLVISDQDWSPAGNVTIIKADVNSQVFMAVMRLKSYRIISGGQVC
jgi:hypothetical protein